MVKNIFLLFCLAILSMGCEKSPPEKSELAVKKPEVAPSLRTWLQIKQSGYITALKLDRETEDALPRSGSTSTYHRQLFTEFAKKHQLEVKWIRASSLKAMFVQLEQFKADIIPRHLTITEKRKNRFSFTYPLLRDKEVVIAKVLSELLSDNQNITVNLPADSSYIDSIQKYYPDWQISLLASALNSEELADGIVAGDFDFSVIDGFAFDTLKQYRDDIKVVKTLPQGIDLAWVTQLNNTSLLYQLNNFISEGHVVQVAEPDRTVDFKVIKKKNLALRVITRNSPDTYFFWRGELLGFEYELMRRFASLNRMKLEMVVADSYDEMLTMLQEGKGDLIAAGLSRTPNRSEKIAKANLQTSIRYNRVSEQIVAHKDSKAINQLDDLAGRTIHVRKSSSFWQTAQQLAKKYGVVVKAADETLSTELIIAQVADKSIDLTIADSNLIAIEDKFRPEIISPLVLKEDIPYAYIVRKKNPHTLAYLNEFIRKHYRKTFYNVVKNKYFNNKKYQIEYQGARLHKGENLSPYDTIVKNKVTEFHFDWRLIISQMYQESRFDPNAVSSAGAKGLMQMLPRTAKELGVTDLSEPEQAIAAGVQYLNWTRDRFSKNMPVQEQIFFSLASYNAGYGHVKDAQRLARQLGLKDDKWFNNVEKAMLLLQKRQYYKKARFGYVRGSEPVNYVRSIHQRYLNYLRISQ